MLCGIIYAALWSAEACFRFGYASLLAGFSGSKLPGQKRRQAAALVRLQAHTVRGVKVPSRHTLSGL